MRIHAVASGRALERAPGALSGRPVRVRLFGAAYTSPAVDFMPSGRVLDRYRFRSPASPDLSPRTITLTFPDGYAERFDDRTGLPKVMHRA